MVVVNIIFNAGEIIKAEQIKEILEQTKQGEISIEQALADLVTLPYEDLGFAKIDHHRQIRCGMPEVIYCPGKTIEQIIDIFSCLSDKGNNVLATRAEQNVYDALVQTGKFPYLQYVSLAKTITLEQVKLKSSDKIIPILTAGTADLRVAKEAQITAEIMGHRTELISDVGVAGLHRLLMQLEKLRDVNVVVVVAGMEGALASVVGGLVDCPVIAVPTSVGYGASFNGIAPLLTMLNSCAAGVSVVNIDNGFSAAVSAALINQKRNDA